MDKITRRAAWWATAISVPITALVASGAFIVARSNDPAAEPIGSAATAGPHPTAAVSMAAPRLAERAATVCPALLAQLPAAVHGVSRRSVTAGFEQNAAYGEPAITLVCGAPMPSIRPADLVFSLSDVCWHSVDRSDATVWTTVDREVAVQLTVPRAYQQPLAATLSEPATGEVPHAVGNLTEHGKWAIVFSGPVNSAVPPLRQAPSGCQG